jgi:hypothetical protein
MFIRNSCAGKETKENNQYVENDGRIRLTVNAPGQAIYILPGVQVYILHTKSILCPTIHSRTHSRTHRLERKSSKSAVGKPLIMISAN